MDISFFFDPIDSSRFEIYEANKVCLGHIIKKFSEADSKKQIETKLKDISEKEGIPMDRLI